jgi:hypothetical protein
MGKSNPTAGYRFKLRNQSGLTYGTFDAYLQFRGGDKPAWQGRQTSSGTISVNAPNLFGGDKDQGGIVGSLYVMMGEATQTPNPMLVSTFGDQTAAWRGFATVAYDGLYGSNNPYPQPQSHKLEKILKGWDNDAPWYPEKAPIHMTTVGSPLPPVAGYFRVEAGSYYTLLGEVANYGTVDTAYVATADEIAANAIAARNLATGSSYVSAGSQLTYLSGHPAIVGWEAGHGPYIGIAAIRVTPVCPDGYDVSFAEGEPATPTVGIDSPVVVCTLSHYGLNAINPAHAIYYLRTQSHKGGEPTANIDDASFRAAADKLYAEGFGICVRIDPDKESIEDVETRICKLIGGSVNRSLVDGKLYLDLARGDYVLEDLPIVTDDDILDFSEQPTTPEGAVNSVSVRYFNPERKETIITPSVDALGLIDAFGLNHQVIDYPEIPVGDLATRIATRELMSYITPSRVFDLVLKPTVYALRPNQYFRLQAPKRGILDMVCIVGDKQGGTLKSGAIRMQAAQDIYTLPEFGAVDIEVGVDTTPPATPVAIAGQVAFEAPYLNVCASLSAADLAALESDAGFLIAAAQDPARSRDFTLMVDAGAGYEVQADGDWCPTAIVNEAAALADPLPVDFTFSAGKRLEEIAVGAVALWGGELVRVDALDTGAGTITLGRGCGDTVPQEHAAGETLWFYGEGSAYDPIQYSDGETVSAKLLTNTWSQQLAPSAATPMVVTFDQRQGRPYPPGKLRIGTSAAPASVTGAFGVSWAHRDRIQQADQLVDTEAASIGPESTVRYALRFEDASTAALIIERTDLGDTDATVQLGASAPASVRMTLWSISDIAASWQVHERVFSYSGGSGAPSIDGVEYIPPPDEVIVDGNDPPPVTGGGAPPTPTPGGAGTPGTPTARTIGSTVVTPTLATGTSAATSNSAAINAAFAGFTAGVGGIVRTPAGDYYIDPAHPIKPLSNCALDLETNGTTLRATNGGLSQGSSFTLHKDLIQVVNSVHDVEIHGGHLIGFRDAWAAAGGTSFYTPGTSEWNHAIYIGDSAHDISVYRLSASKCTGDGISIGRTAYNVHVLNVLSTDNRRQGISAAGISASANIKIENCECSYIGVGDGTSPMAGIDCEVDNPSVNSTSGIQIISCHLHHNVGPGLICYKSVNNITISNLVSEYNSKGIYGVDSDNVTISGTSKIRYNKYEGLHLRGSCSSWSVRADFFDNKTKRYGAPSGSTTTSPSSTLKSKNVTVETTVTGLTYDPTTTWGAV